MIKRYDFRELEKKWRPYWSEIDLYKTGDDPGKPKYYILDYFPYPSGDGLSVGHCRNYVPTCVAARFRRMRGYNVLHPMGWDAFGLPAENYAIAHGVHPRITTARHNANYRRQMRLIECSYDWSREFSSADPEYYQWTQWFFLLLFKEGLAYQAMGSQWWCPKDKTILANEQVENGRCWRCNSLVTKKELKQWYFKITDYADRLLDDLETVDWPEPIKLMQRNWIGRSEGAEVIFSAKSAGVSGTDERFEIPAFTTRPDTLFGVTFLVLAPEHPLVSTLTSDKRRQEVSDYVEHALRMTEIDRLAVEAEKEKTGVFTGAYASHPITGVDIPVWVADYVVLGYGSGAVMGVPGHDERDYDFARKHSLPIVEVISPDGAIHGGVRHDGARNGGARNGGYRCNTEKGIMINSGDYSGLTSEVGSERIIADLNQIRLGDKVVTYRMRDWLISRQRYWGAPIPIVHCSGCGTVAVPEEELPVLLPDLDQFEPTGDGRSPLARVKDWVRTTCPQCGGPAERETDTMDGFACSSWYFLRFTNPNYREGPIEPASADYWMPVDTYVGGAEHAVMHLLYSRFWTKVMYDTGLVPYVEPFTELRNQGVLHAADGQRMSKSKGNVVTPDEVVAEHGADALRAYILFIGPFDGDVIWDDANIRGVNRFLERYWKLAWSLDSGIGQRQGDKVTGREYSAWRQGDKETGRQESGRQESAWGREYSAWRQGDWPTGVGPRVLGLAMGVGPRIVGLEVHGNEPGLGHRDDGPRVLGPRVLGLGEEAQFRREMHRVIKRVTEDLERFKFNTAVAALMQYLNYLYEQRQASIRPTLWREAVETLTILMCPIAPFITEEIWQEALGHSGQSVHQVAWPAYDAALTVSPEITIMVQVNGKLRDKVTVPAHTGDEELLKIILSRPKVQRQIDGKSLRRTVVVPDKLVNLVVNSDD